MFYVFSNEITLHQTFSKILTQQQFSIYYRPYPSTSHHLYYLHIIHKTLNQARSSFCFYDSILSTNILWPLLEVFQLMFIDFKKFLNVFTFLVTKPREVTSSNINWKFHGGMRSSLLISLHLVSLYSRDFVVLVSYKLIQLLSMYP